MIEHNDLTPQSGSGVSLEYIQWAACPGTHKAQDQEGVSKPICELSTGTGIFGGPQFSVSINLLDFNVIQCVILDLTEYFGLNPRGQFLKAVAQPSQE